MAAIASSTSDIQTQREFSWDERLVEGYYKPPVIALTVFLGESNTHENHLIKSDLEVDYGSQEIASMIYAALAVDKELQPDKVKREMSVSNGKLSVHFEAIEPRFLRASYSAFVDVLTLATKTIEEFGKGIEL